jgi:16S rRNA (guanine1207-N2)-methyltransferase
VELVLPEGTVVRLLTDRGTFSPDHIDEGTKALLAHGQPSPRGGTLVDLGAGYGPIAIALAMRAPAAEVWAVEVNQRARELCERNARTLGLGERLTVIDPDGWPDLTTIDELWSNPPIRIGKAALHDLLTRWLDRLTPATGRAYLVVQKHLGADSLARWLTDQGWPTTRLARRGAYRILQVEARP